MIAVIIRIHNCLTFCPTFTFHVDFQCYKKLLKYPQSWKTRSVRGVWMGKSGPLERAELANQIQGFRIPEMLQKTRYGSL